jgi:hypothetical protein
MSVFHPLQISCTHCGDTQERTVAATLHGPRVPEVAEQIRKGIFQRVKCGACSEIFSIDSPLTYLDFKAGFWLTMYPLAWEVRWKTLEHEPRRDMIRAVCENAPPSARSFADGMRVRAVFGLEALREKLLCFESDLPDDALEVLKLQLLKARKDVPLHPRTRPRLIAVEDARLIFHQPLVDGGEVVSVPRTMLTQLQDNPLPWVHAHTATSDGAYTDIGRLMMKGTG